MSLVTLKYVLKGAATGNYAVGSFNCFGLETIQDIVAAAKAKHSPIIVQSSMSTLVHVGEKTMVGMVEGISNDYDTPVVLHLDHADNVDLVKRCIDNGFTSVMIDASKKPFAENVHITKEVVRYASSVGCSVEAELGHVTANNEDISIADREALFTEPDMAKKFAEETGCDALAVAVGTAHGFYKFPPKLDFKRIQEIHTLIPNMALVLHGGTGVPDDQFRESIPLGIRKINIGTEIWFNGYGNVMKQYATDMPLNSDPRLVMEKVREACQAIVEHKIDVFGSANRL
jgi:ketose-bisphosphate aldolase